MLLRMASPDDSSGLLEIYRPYVENTDVTFEIAVPDDADFKERVCGILKAYPYIVCEHDGELLGYAYAQRIFSREAYRFCAELSVYVKQGFGGRGIGLALSKAVLEILKLQNVVTVYSLVTYPNIPSERLHEKLGFERKVIFENAGYKLGSWHGDAWFEKKINPPLKNPPELLKISEIEPKSVAEILFRNEKSLG